MAGAGRLRHRRLDRANTRLISGLSRWGERLLDTSIQMLRNVPHLALIPLVILWFGIDETAKIFLVSLGTLFPIYINTWHGIRNIDRWAG
ncbi:alkanesulfonate transporter permease subunit [Klebsiella pneumoniae]|uniref:Alkanesulfonate transporter permease subunit n=1 Tax=Klebsiella pneumoniae TaxID=573 RepID=A0A378AG10_KLEPN|nr:alkanesulfonate transporter permease subunit [Klebsiella pneumoniae]